MVEKNKLHYTLLRLRATLYDSFYRVFRTEFLFRFILSHLPYEVLRDNLNKRFQTDCSSEEEKKSILNVKRLNFILSETIIPDEWVQNGYGSRAKATKMLPLKMTIILLDFVFL